MKYVATGLSFVWLMLLCSINYPKNYHQLLKIFHNAVHCVLSNFTKCRMLNALEGEDFCIQVTVHEVNDEN